MKKLLPVLYVCLLLIGFNVPAMAEDNQLTTKFYGQLWFNTDYEKLNSKASGIGHNDTNVIFGFDESFTRFGAYMYYGKFTGQVEVRPVANSPLRQWGGEYDFGGYKVFIGNAYTPIFIRSDLMGRNDIVYLQYMGVTPYLRRQMARLTMPLGIGTFKVAAIKPAAKRVVDAKGTWITGPPDVQTFSTVNDLVMPKIEAAYDITTKTGEYYVSGGYVLTREVVKATGDKYDISSYYAGAYACNAFGPLTVKASGYLSQNGSEYDDDGAALLSAVYNTSRNTIENTTGFGCHLAASYKINDKYSIQGGYGFVHWEVANANAALPKNEEENAMFYINMPIQFSKPLSFTITPEICIFDNKDSKAGNVKIDQGKKSYYGVTWLVKF
jgi:hypothetical protein